MFSKVTLYCMEGDLLHCKRSPFIMLSVTLCYGMPYSLPREVYTGVG